MTNRRKKTAAERAQEAYDVADRAVTRLRTKRDALKADLAAAEEEYDAACRRLDYVGRNPDLPEQFNAPSTKPSEPSTDNPHEEDNTDE